MNRSWLPPNFDPYRTRPGSSIIVSWPSMAHAFQKFEEAARLVAEKFEDMNIIWLGAPTTPPYKRNKREYGRG